MAELDEPGIIKNLPHTKVIGRGRPKGSGKNMELLRRLTPGSTECIWAVTQRKRDCLRWAAFTMGIHIKVRMIKPNSYCIWRIT